MNLPAALSGRASRDVVLAAMLLTLCRVSAHDLAQATGASAHISNSGARATLAADPVVDGAYVQAQLAYLVTRDPRREAGQDTDLPRTRNGHDEFAADWLAALRSDLYGLPLQVSRQTFRLPGFRGRPPKTPGVNLIVA